MRRTVPVDLTALAERSARDKVPPLSGLHEVKPTHRRHYRRAAVLLLFSPADSVSAAASQPHAPGVDIFLVQRAPWLRHHPGQIALPGGGQEPGDRNLIDTALREAHEEIGVPPHRVDVLGALPEVSVPISRNIVTPVLGWSPDPGRHSTNDDTEVLHTLRIPVAELLDPQSRATVTIEGMRSAGFPVGGSWVWGFTGNLLDYVFTQLGWTRQWPRDRQYLMSRAEAVGADLPGATT